MEKKTEIALLGLRYTLGMDLLNEWLKINHVVDLINVSIRCSSSTVVHIVTPLSSQSQGEGVLLSFFNAPVTVSKKINSESLDPKDLIMTTHGGGA